MPASQDTTVQVCTQLQCISLSYNITLQQLKGTLARNMPRLPQCCCCVLRPANVSCLKWCA